jgi:mono/diheme cytochrome c family protein
MKRTVLFTLAASALLGCSVVAPEDQQQVFVPVQRGEQLYNTYCVTCHGGSTGGRMMDIPPVHNRNGHTWHHPDCQLTDIVLHGSGSMGEMMRRMMGASEDTPTMPAFSGILTQADAEAILAHIKTWWTPQQRAMQAAVTQERC